MLLHEFGHVAGLKHAVSGYPVRDAIQREFDAWNDYSEAPAEVIARRDEAETTLQ